MRVFKAVRYSFNCWPSPGIRAWAEAYRALLFAFSILLPTEASALEPVPSARPAETQEPANKPVKRSLGAIGQQAPQPSQSAARSGEPPAIDRNAAYFNRPGAIPRTSFQPINNNAPSVLSNVSPVSPPPPAAAAPQSLQVPAASQQPAGARQIIRPAPLGAPRILRERTRLVPGVIIQPKPARVFPAHGPGASRDAAIPSTARPAPVASPGQNLSAPFQTLQALGTAQPGGQGTLPAVDAPRAGSFRPLTPASPRAPSTGSLPTVSPRPKSLMEGTKQTQQAKCPTGLPTCK